jgi:signal transduction histidine kinase
VSLAGAPLPAAMSAAPAAAVAVQTVAPVAPAASAAGARQLVSTEYLTHYHDAAPAPEGEIGLPLRLPVRSAIGGRALPGSSWFRLRADFDPDRDSNFSIYVPRVSPNATVYLNGSRVGASEDFDDPSADTWNYPLRLGLPSALMRRGENQFLIEVRYNPYSERVGLSRVWVGPEGQLSARYHRRLWLQVNGVEVVSLLVGVIGLFALVLWLRRRSEVVFGLFALSCAIWIFRNTQFIVIHSFGPYFRYSALTDGALFWLVAVLFRFCCRLLERPLPVIERTMFVLAFLVTVAIWAGGPEHEGITSAAGYALLVPPSVALVIYLSMIAFTGRTVEQLLLWLAAVVTSASGAYDLMVLLGKVPWPGIYVMPYSALFFAVTLGWALADRFVLAHSRYERLNRELDTRVRAREQELEVHYQRATELEREQAIASERERILRDMHDGMGLHLISSMRLVESSDLSRAQVSALLVEAMDELRIAIDSAKPTGRDLLVMLGNLRYRLEPRLQAAGLALHWDIGNVARLDTLTANQVVEITRIVQEAFTNVLKHASASELHLRVDAPPGEPLELSIEDNGRGFDAREAQLGEGVRNMRSRANRIGAQLAIDSQPGRTRVVLRIGAAGEGASLERRASAERRASPERRMKPD